MNNPNLKGMDPEKLKMLNNIANQGSQKGMNELLPFLMSAVSQNKSQSGGLDFSRQEMDTIIEVLKMGKPPEEVARINRMMQIIKMRHLTITAARYQVPGGCLYGDHLLLSSLRRSKFSRIHSLRRIRA